MKNTTIRKITAALLCALMLLSAPMGMNFPGGFPLTASAASYSGTCGENLTWTLDTETGLLTITGTGEMNYFGGNDGAPWHDYCSVIQKVQIANGVTSISSWAFENCTSLTDITIPDSVTSIEQYAFRGCTSLTSITIPNSVTSIEYFTFLGCTSLTNVTIPDGVTSIEFGAFNNCTSLTSISLPDSVTSIRQWAFSDTGFYNDASNWTDGVLYIGHHLIGAKESVSDSYTVKTGTKCIADWAFSFCTSLTNITIPDSVISIGFASFASCTSLTSFTVDPANQFYSSDSHGVLFDKSKTTLIQFPAGSTFTEYTIPNSVTSIESYAFEDCSSLNYVHIPDSVTSIGKYILDSPAYICSDTAECYAKEYADANGIEFRVCDGHGAEPELPKFDGNTGTVQADCTPGCFDEDAHLVVSESDKTLPEFGITVSGYVQVQKSYNIQVQNTHGQPLQPKSGHTVTLRLPLPLDDHGNPYDAGKYSVYHLIDNDPANAESFRAKKGNLKIENGFLVIEVSHFSPFVVVVESEMPTVSIAGNPGTTTLRYKETLVLHAEAENLPDGASLLWEADKDGIVELKPSGDGTTCEVISKKSGTVKITVKVVDADGNEIEGSGSDTETVQSKAGFFQKLLAFFRLLLGIKVRIDQRKK